MKKKMMGLVGVVMLVGVMLVGLMGMAFANSVTFELSTSTGDGSLGNPYDMNNSDNGKTESGGVSIGTGGTLFWKSDFAAGQETFFPVATWSVTMHVASDPGTDLQLTVGSYDPDTDTFNDINGTGGPISANTYSAISSQATYTITDVYDGVDHDLGTPGDQFGFLVPAGDTIMLRVTNTSGVSSYFLSTSETNQSTVHYPGTENPAWPVPEIATIVMIALGVMALGGYVWMRRQQVAPVVA